MRKYLGYARAKALMMIILIIGLIMTSCGMGLLLFRAEVGASSVEKDLYRVAANTYAAQLLSQEGGVKTNPGLLEGGNMQYAIVQTKEPDPHNVDLSNPDVYLYKSPDYQNYLDYFVGYDGYYYYYNTESFLKAWLNGIHSYDERYAVNTEDVYDIVLYNVRDPLLPAETHSDLFTEARDMAGIINGFLGAAVWMLLIGIVLSIFSAVWLMCSAGRRAGDEAFHSRRADRIPFGVYLAIVIFAESIGIGIIISFLQEMSYGLNLTYVLIFGLICLGTFIGMIVLGMLFCMSIAVRVKTKTFKRYTVCHYLLKGLIALRDALRSHTPMMFRCLAVIGAVSVLQLLVILFTEYDLGVEVAAFLIYKCIEVPLLIFGLIQMAKIINGTKQIAAGETEAVIDTHRMYWDFKTHAEDINHIGSGISAAVEARMRSERMKTELITNVSHDIKTPLTSIINYVDLLEKEPLENEKAKEYVDVLSRQSARLKKLIGDLLDASKASTGNIDLTMEPCDMSVIMTQAMGEFEERMTGADLTPVTALPEGSVYVMADGRQLWRVFENLLGNICKYAMPGTRVYASLGVKNQRAEIVFKNISASPLNFSGDELAERFVRGDTSRSTEGSGLGLSIAESLCKLMNGSMAIEIDGDLFKVTLSFPVIQ